MNPHYVDKGINAREQARMFAFIKTHVGGDDYIKTQAEFLAYRRKDDGFENAKLWDPRVA